MTAGSGETFMAGRLFENNEENKALYYFEEISRVPRESGHEEKIAEYLMDFASGLGLESEQDSVGNVIIRKAGSLGREDEEPVILQAHMDMVCEKVPESSHDFRKDPIKLIREGDILRADGTTLGADDGIGTALAMAALEDDDYEHPPIEVLITVEEETTFGGAAGAEEKYFRGRRIINLDHAVEHQVLCGSCGGEACSLTIPVGYEEAHEGYAAYGIDISGMNGGHSGEDIHRGYGSAIQLLTRILRRLSEEISGVRLSDLAGGTNRLAISRDASATVLVPENEVPALKEIFDSLSSDFRKEYRMTDKEMALTLTAKGSTYKVLDGKADKEPDGKVDKKTAPMLTGQECADKALDGMDDKESALTFSAKDNPDIVLNGNDEKKTAPTLTAKDRTDKVLTDQSFKNIINLMSVAPDGIQKMSGAIQGLVESSLNIGEMRITDDGFQIVAEVRGSPRSTVLDILEKLDVCAGLFGGKTSRRDRYSAWSYDPDSRLRAKAKQVYKELFDEELEEIAVHAGIEIGLFMDEFDELDAISLGPDCWSFHSPDEHMSISSAEREWKFLKALLEAL